jgi:hypothetical protein
MYDLETPACPSTHYRAPNEWLRKDEPTVQWFSKPSKLGQDFIKHHNLAAKYGQFQVQTDAILLALHAPVVSGVQLQSIAVVQPLENEFASLVTAWREATENVSSLTQILSHAAYQRVIDLGKRGEPVLPLILRDLEKNRGYWATALQTITGENPVSAKHIGNPAKVREDWIAWGRRHGHL